MTKKIYKINVTADGCVSFNEDVGLIKLTEQEYNNWAKCKDDKRSKELEELIIELVSGHIQTGGSIEEASEEDIQDLDFILTSDSDQ